MPSFVEGATNIFLYHPMKRRPRKGSRHGSWVHGSNALVVVCPDASHEIKDAQDQSRPCLRFGGREHSVGELDGRYVVVQHGSDPHSGYSAVVNWNPALFLSLYLCPTYQSRSYFNRASAGIELGFFNLSSNTHHPLRLRTQR